MIDDDESENLKHDFFVQQCPWEEIYDALVGGKNERIWRNEKGLLASFERFLKEHKLMKAD